METPPIPSEESVTFSIKKSSRNAFFAKMIILLTLTLLLGYFYGQDGARRYEKGRELTQEKYLEKFDEYKGALLNGKQFENPLLSTFAAFIVISFLIGSYELTALIIGFLIGKVIRR
ncbi:hypothetical protein [Nostoc sp. UHCC 0870]|uniref:hypothetical protein n=1 Tax=Nostoc sp. UHCC 0870 TaxID=2914041 RepID=UPI001EDDE43A|nr:hypothetical protein [Nostoc sp. UHCC 0870]UKO99947.1 hypothetical protein L6494_09670 [Nostoc sp. UHCC 0870]